jgi:hypothetical protein
VRVRGGRTRVRMFGTRVRMFGTRVRGVTVDGAGDRGVRAPRRAA